MTSKISTKHLDIGSGASPRNPYGQDMVFACDIQALANTSLPEGTHYHQANLVTQPIPFPDSYFDSVSAFDFLEHVPRQLINERGELINPFINLMSEVHRVLRNGGVFLALTPAYPHPSVFTDPTHVNFITDKTHEYFTGENPYARIYGFHGAYRLLHARWDVPSNVYEPQTPALRGALKRFHRRLFKGGLSHYVWELEAVKSN